MAREQSLILLTGATGYIGGRLLPLLEQRSLRLRCVCRQPERLRSRVALATEVVQGDVMDLETLRAALSGVHAAFYLVHSLGTKRDFEQEDRQAAAKDVSGQIKEPAGMDGRRVNSRPALGRR